MYYIPLVKENKYIFNKQNTNNSAYHNKKRIVSVTKTFNKNYMRCITVDSPTGTFLCGNNYTVTHNSFMSAPFIMARSLLIPSHNTYIMGPSGSQSQETFTKLENLAKNNIASVIGVSSFFLDETVKQNVKADPFTHDKSGYFVKLYNGSTVNTLNSVAKNIVGIRSNFNKINVNVPSDRFEKILLELLEVPKAYLTKTEKEISYVTVAKAEKINKMIYG